MKEESYAPEFWKPGEPLTFDISMLPLPETSVSWQFVTPPRGPWNCRCVMVGADEGDRQDALARIAGLIRGPGERLRQQLTFEGLMFIEEDAW